VEFLARPVSQEKEINGIQIEKDNMSLYLNDPKKSIKKLFDLINMFSKVAGWKINT
jgi:hypothetical protein